MTKLEKFEINVQKLGVIVMQWGLTISIVGGLLMQDANFLIYGIVYTFVAGSILVLVMAIAGMTTGYRERRDSDLAYKERMQKKDLT